MWWSYSTHRTKRLCQRMLVYEQKVASPTTNDSARREAFLLRQLQSLPEWQGILVHETLKDCLVPRLRLRSPFSIDDLVHHAERLAVRQWDFSAKQRFREPGMVKTAQGDVYCALRLHETGELSISRSEALATVAEFCHRCFQNLMDQSDLLATLRSASNFVAERQLTFPLSVATVRAIPDLVCRLPNKGFLIVDWKTVASETDDYANQLYLYALAAIRSDRWADIEPENILLREANLFQGIVRAYPVTPARLALTEDFAYASIRESETLLAGISKADFLMEDYEVAEKTTTCALCAFQSMCRRDIQRSVQQQLPFVSELAVSKRRVRLNKEEKHEIRDTAAAVLDSDLFRMVEGIAE